MTNRAERETVFDRWNQFMLVLSAQPRRQIVISLMDVPEEKRLSLPEAALTSTISVDLEQFTIELQHHHLPFLSDAGYVRWEKDPFCVQRGPYFEEPSAVMRILLSSSDRLPETLATGCISEEYDDE